MNCTATGKVDFSFTYEVAEFYDTGNKDICELPIVNIVKKIILIML